MPPPFIFYHLKNKEKKQISSVVVNILVIAILRLNILIINNKTKYKHHLVAYCNQGQ